MTKDDVADVLLIGSEQPAGMESDRTVGRSAACPRFKEAAVEQPRASRTNACNDRAGLHPSHLPPTGRSLKIELCTELHDAAWLDRQRSLPRRSIGVVLGEHRVDIEQIVEIDHRPNPPGARREALHHAKIELIESLAI